MAAQVTMGLSRSALLACLLMSALPASGLTASGETDAVGALEFVPGADGGPALSAYERT